MVGLHNIAGNASIATRSGGKLPARAGQLRQLQGHRPARRRPASRRTVWQNYAVAVQPADGYRDHSEAQGPLVFGASWFFTPQGGASRFRPDRPPLHRQRRGGPATTTRSQRTSTRPVAGPQRHRRGRRQAEPVCPPGRGGTRRPAVLERPGLPQQPDDHRFGEVLRRAPPSRNASSSRPTQVRPEHPHLARRPDGHRADLGDGRAGRRAPGQPQSALQHDQPGAPEARPKPALRVRHPGRLHYVQAEWKPIPPSPWCRPGVSTASRGSYTQPAERPHLPGQCLARQAAQVLGDLRVQPGWSVYGNWGRSFQVGVARPRTRSTRPAIWPHRSTKAPSWASVQARRWLDGRVAVWRQTASNEARRRLNDPPAIPRTSARPAARADLQLNARRPRLGLWMSAAYQESGDPAGRCRVGSHHRQEIGPRPAPALQPGRRLPVRGDALRVSAWVNGQSSYYLERSNTSGKFGNSAHLNLSAGYRFTPAVSAGC